MTILNVFSRSKSSKAEKTPSKPVRVAAICVVLATGGVVLKVASDVAWIVTEIQHTIAPVSQIPSEAKGAFYFIEPETATL